MIDMFYHMAVYNLTSKQVENNDQPEERQAEEEHNLCTICHERRVNALILDCNHATTCMECAYQCEENLTQNEDGHVHVAPLVGQR